MRGETSSTLEAALSGLFGASEGDVITALLGRTRMVHLKRGEVLYRQGEPGTGMHVVVTGRLQVRVTAKGCTEDAVVAHLTPGEAVGEVALFTGGERSATVLALRDSTLGFLAADAFEALVERHPAAASHVARFIIGRLVETQRRGRASGPGVHSLAVVPLDTEIDAGEFARRLQLALMRHGATALADAETVHARFAGALGANQDESVIELERYLDGTEKDHEFAILEADSETSQWTRKCIAYADVVVFAAMADTPVDEAAERALDVLRHAGEPSPPCELALVHAGYSMVPAGTVRWLESVPCQRHLHVPWAGDEGFNRLARILSGNAIAVVLGGGGARGFAHVGVVRAIREAGVPIDAIGGTSFGAIVAGAVAIGWDDSVMLDRFKAAFVDERPMDDYTLPILSLVRGEKMASALHRHFGDARIEDLWIPFFAVSSNLSRNQEQVHRRGMLWRALRASASLPAIFPPFLEGGELLVDGGLLNNLPVDVMRRSLRGRVIAVDLSASDDFSYELEQFPTAWEFLKARTRRSTGRLKVPTIDRVVLKSTMLGSRREVEAARREADLFLNPPTAQFDLLDWPRFHEISEVGYQHALAKIADWLVAHPDIVQADLLFDSRMRGA